MKNTIATNSFHCIPDVDFMYIYKIKSAVFFCESYQERYCDWSFDNPPKVSNFCVIPAPAMITWVHLHRFCTFTINAEMYAAQKYIVLQIKWRSKSNQIKSNQMRNVKCVYTSLDQSGLTLCYQKNSLLEPRWSVLVLVDLQDAQNNSINKMSSNCETCLLIC